MELDRFHHGVSGVRMEHYDHLNMLTVHSLQQIFHVLDGGIDVQFFGFAHLAAARRPAWLIRSISRFAESMANCCYSRCAWPIITIIRLLKSWAMPPADRPMASIFCDCWSAWTVRLCSVISVFVSMMWVRPSVVDVLAQCTRRNWSPGRVTSLESTVSLAIHQTSDRNRRGPAPGDLVVAGLSDNIAKFIEPGLVLELDLMGR